LIDTPVFTIRWNELLQEIVSLRDVFLGYCIESSRIAEQIQLRVERHGASVLDWVRDFRAGGTILGEIERARARCTCGIFLFSEDDPLEGHEGAAAPRDNVVFEAGYFMSSKGAPRCLIIRAGRAKMPADVGGTIYLPLANNGDVSAIEGKLLAFLDSNL
jgi:predicted nucleotide-binding protein